LKLLGIDLSLEGLVGIRKEQGEIETGGNDDTGADQEVEVVVDDTEVGVGVGLEVEEGTVVGVVDEIGVGAEVETGTAGVEVEIGTVGGEGVIPEVALEAEAEADTNPIKPPFLENNPYLPNQPKNLIRLDDF